MKIKCDYCGSFIDDTDDICPHCGGVNEHVMRSADGIPKTVEELQAFCRAKNLPLTQMRFYIGTPTIGKTTITPTTTMTGTATIGTGAAMTGISETQTGTLIGKVFVGGQ